MSWNVQKTVGTPEKVKEAVSAAFDQAAKNYAGKTEGTDVESAKAAVLSWIEEAKSAGQTGVMVEANGSRGASWLSVKVECSTFNLLK